MDYEFCVPIYFSFMGLVSLAGELSSLGVFLRNWKAVWVMGI